MHGVMREMESFYEVFFHLSVRCSCDKAMTLWFVDVLGRGFPLEETAACVYFLGELYG